MVSVGPPAGEEAADHKRLLDIQNLLLRDLFGGGPARNLKEGCQLLGLRTTKVLVILDDVWRASDISQLLPIDQLEPGSCVVATSRRVDLLTRCTTVSIERPLPLISSVLCHCIEDRRELSSSAAFKDLPMIACHRTKDQLTGEQQGRFPRIKHEYPVHIMAQSESGVKSDSAQNARRVSHSG